MRLTTSRGRDSTASTRSSLARTLCRRGNVPLGVVIYSLCLWEIRPAAAWWRPDGRARFDGRAQTCGINNYDLNNHLIHKPVCAPDRVAQFPKVSLRGADAFAPQKIVKDFAKNHQLACHFVNQSALVKADLRV